MTTYTHLGHACDHCGRIYYTGTVTGRPRRYCSSACRQAAYRRAVDDERGRRITEEARRTLAQSAAFRNVADGPGGPDRRFDVTKPTERPESDANSADHTNTHAGAKTSHSGYVCGLCGSPASVVSDHPAGPLWYCSPCGTSDYIVEVLPCG
jgi:hypothetical protein